MKSASLQKFVTSSETRKSLLYELAARPMSLTELRAHYHVASSTILPRIKDLIQIDLVVKENNKYRLTTTGMILSGKLRMMDDLDGVIGTCGKFLNEHDLSPIPARLIDRIDELGNCELIRNNLDNMTATHDRIYDNIPKSKCISGISPAFASMYPEFYLAMARRGIQVSLVLTEPVFRKVESDYSSFLEAYLSSGYGKLFVTDEIRLAFVVTDQFVSMYLCGHNGALDSMSSLLSFDQSAVRWGNELFQGYLERSKQIR